MRLKTTEDKCRMNMKEFEGSFFFVNAWESTVEIQKLFVHAKFQFDLKKNTSKA